MKIDKSWTIVCAIAAIIFMASALGAQEGEKKEGVGVGYSAICTDVQNREPVGVDTIFSAAVESLFCFTRIEGAADTTSITHVWYYGEKKMAEITLSVRSVWWRTWSRKTILSEWTGKWNVVILSEAGDPLAQIPFFIKPSESD